MERITRENIDKDIFEILSNCPMTWQSLERLALLYKVRKHIPDEHEYLTEEEAHEWCKHMCPPARWTIEQTNALLQQKGYCHNPYEFYAVMNSMASDHGKTMAKYNADKPDIWAELAHDWLDDADAVSGKASVYYREIVEK